MTQLKLKKIESGSYEIKKGDILIRICQYDGRWNAECKVGEYENKDGSLNFEYDEFNWTSTTKRECCEQVQIWIDNLD